MTLKLYYHPLSSYCWKALIGLYEVGAAFEPVLVNLGDPAERAKLEALWPVCKFPVLHDEARGVVVPETSIIIEYVDRHYPGDAALIPADPEHALEARLRDRFYDLYVHTPMQAIVADRLRPADKRDPFGVAMARAALARAYAIVDADTARRTWAAGDAFSLADCAAAPALYYANRVAPLTEDHGAAGAYLQRLLQRPSFARVVREAEPYFHMFPEDKP